MNISNYKPSNNLIIFCFTSLLLLTNNSYALDIGVLQEQCAEIGFKKKTPENGKCVLKLMKSIASQQTEEADQQKTYTSPQAAQAALKTSAIRPTLSNGTSVWTMADSNHEGTLYNNLSTIQRDGYLVKIWMLHDFKAVQQKDGVLFLSQKIQIEFDCMNNQMLPLAFSVFSGNMGEGDIVHSESSIAGHLSPIPPGSLVDRAEKAACGNSFTKQPVQQQNEAGIGTTLLQGLGSGIQLLGAVAQGYSQGLRQSVPSYPQIIQPTVQSIQPIQDIRPIKCHTSVSGFGNYRSADTTCR